MGVPVLCCPFVPVLCLCWLSNEGLGSLLGVGWVSLLGGWGLLVGCPCWELFFSNFVRCGGPEVSGHQNSVWWKGLEA